MILRAVTLFAAIAVASCAGPVAPESSPVSDGRYVMGTVLEITLHGGSEREARSLLAELFAGAERLDGMSLKGFVASDRLLGWIASWIHHGDLFLEADEGKIR